MKNNKFKKYFYDTNAKYVISSGENQKHIQKNILRNLINKNYDHLNNISEMNMDISRSKFLETSLNSSSQLNNWNSEKKTEISIMYDSNSENKKKISNNNLNFMNSGGVYDFKYDENKKQHILLISNKKVNEISKKENKDTQLTYDKNYMKGIYSNCEINDINQITRNSKFFNNVLTTESLGIKEEGEFNSNVIVTHLCDDKNDVNIINKLERDLDSDLKSNAENKQSLPFKLSKKDSNEINPFEKYDDNKNTIESDRSNSKNKSKQHRKKSENQEEYLIQNNNDKMFLKQKSLERNQSTKNLLIDKNYLRKLQSKESECNKHELDIIMENNNSNKVNNKEIEKNYCNIQTRKSLKKNNDNNIKPQQVKTFQYANYNNKQKKNVDLNRNISGSPYDRLGNTNDLKNNKEKNKNYYDSKMYKEKKERNLKMINIKNQISEKEKVSYKESKNNLMDNIPFKLASDYDSNSKKKSSTLNRVQSVQNLLNDNMKLDKSLLDSKEKTNDLFHSKSLVKSNTSKKVEKKNYLGVKNDSNKFINKNQKNSNSNNYNYNNKKSPFENDTASNNKEGSYTKGFKTIHSNINSSYRESKNPQVKEKNFENKVNLANNEKYNKCAIKFKSNPKIENRKNFNLNYPEKSDLSSNLFKYSSVSRINKLDEKSKSKGIQFESDNKYNYQENSKALLKKQNINEISKQKEKESQSKILKEIENNEIGDTSTSQKKKNIQLNTKHKKTYSDFSTPSPILKAKPKAISSNNLKNSNRFLNSNFNNNYNYSNNNHFNNLKNEYNNKELDYSDYKYIQSEKLINKGKLNFHESNNASKNQNINSNTQSNRINFSNLNSKEANQTIPREDEIRNSNTNNNFIDNQIVNKNLMSYDVTFKDIPIFDNIETKQKLINKNSLKNPELSLNLLNFKKNENKPLLANKDSNNSETNSPVKLNMNSVNLLNNLNSNDIREFNKKAMETGAINNIKDKGASIAAAYSNLNINNFNIHKGESLNTNKLEIPSLDNFINSPSIEINKDISNPMNYRENSEIPVESKKADENFSGQNKDNIDNDHTNDISKSKSYKIIDTVHLNKFLNSRSNNLIINNFNAKTKTTTIANFVSISNQENMKINFNKNENVAINFQNLLKSNNFSNASNNTPIKRREETLKENPHDEIKKNLVAKNINHQKNKSNHQEKNHIDNNSDYNNNSLGIMNNITNKSVKNNLNRDSNPTNYKYKSLNNDIIKNTKLSSDMQGPPTDSNQNPININSDNSKNELILKKSDTSNFNSKNTRLYENSSIENCLQITADNYSKNSNDKTSSNNNLKNSFNNFGSSNILLNNENFENKSSTGSIANLLSMNSKIRDPNKLPFKIENNNSSINNSKITSNSLNSYSNNSNSNNKNSNLSNSSNHNTKVDSVNKDGAANAYYLIKKNLNSDINNFNKNNTLVNNLNQKAAAANGNFTNEKLFQNRDEVDKKKTNHNNIESLHSNLNVSSKGLNMHKKTKSSDFKGSTEKYSNKFIENNVSNNLNKNLNFKNNTNGNSNIYFVSNNNVINNCAIPLSVSSANFNLNKKTQQNVFISTNFQNTLNPTNPPMNSRHRKNSYSHTFISFAGNKQNNNNNNLENNEQNNINNNNITNYNNFNNHNVAKMSSNINSKEKEKIILNFSSNNSSNINLNNVSKNNNNDCNNNLFIAPFISNQKCTTTYQNLNLIGKNKGSSNILKK